MAVLPSGRISPPQRRNPWRHQHRVGEKRAPASAWATALTVAAFTVISPASLTHDIQSSFNRADWLTSAVDAKDAGAFAFAVPEIPHHGRTIRGT